MNIFANLDLLVLNGASGTPIELFLAGIRKIEPKRVTALELISRHPTRSKRLKELPEDV